MPPPPEPLRNVPKVVAEVGGGQGAAEIARVIELITATGEWDTHWEDRLRLDDKILSSYGGVAAS